MEHTSSDPTINLDSNNQVSLIRSFAMNIPCRGIEKMWRKSLGGNKAG